MQWAGLDRRRFRWITHLDNSTYVKPRVEYYHQISDAIGRPPQACIMVGNDAVNDMVAGSAGMTTYLTNEAGAVDYSAVTRGRNIRPGQPYGADFTGPLADLLAVVERLRSS